MTAAAAIAAALDDLRFAVSVLRKDRALAVDLETLKGGAAYLNHDTPALADAYANEVDRRLARMPGLTSRGTKLLAA